MTITGSEALLYFAVKNDGNWDKILESVRKKEEIDDDLMLKIREKYQGRYVTYLDDAYPQQLKQIQKSPFVLFYYGDISLVKDYEKIISIVGAREPSKYGSENLPNIVKGLVPNYNIVSGLAKGIDTLAHQTCIDNGGKTIAVLGCGLDQCYPASNQQLFDNIKKDHLLLSEYPDGVNPEVTNFPMRNRIVVGLSKGLIVFDCKDASGTLTAANMACSFNRDLMSIPYPVGSGYYNNRLIDQGAYLIETSQDVIDNLNHY